MYSRIRRFAPAAGVMIIIVLAAEGFSSARASGLGDVARHLYQIHAENFYCTQEPTPWDELISYQQPGVVTKIYEATASSHVQGPLQSMECARSTGSYDRELLFSSQPANAP